MNGESVFVVSVVVIAIIVVGIPSGPIQYRGGDRGYTEFSVMGG